MEFWSLDYPMCPVNRILKQQCGTLPLSTYSTPNGMGGAGKIVIVCLVVTASERATHLLSSSLVYSLCEQVSQSSTCEKPQLPSQATGFQFHLHIAIIEGIWERWQNLEHGPQGCSLNWLEEDAMRQCFANLPRWFKGKGGAHNAWPGSAVLLLGR